MFCGSTMLEMVGGGEGRNFPLLAPLRGGTTATDIHIQRLYELGGSPWAKGEACQGGCIKGETANGPANHGSDTRGQDRYAVKGVFRGKTSPLLAKAKYLLHFQNDLHATAQCEAKGLYTPDQRRNTNSMALDLKGNHKTLAGVSGVDWRKGKVLNCDRISGEA
eukprot:SM000212S06929  [mRNA]  locus=s212:171528:174716:- [translate_table: standard]